MEKLIINIDNKNAKGKALLLYLKALAHEANSFLNIESDKIDHINEKAILTQIEAGLKDVKKIQEGKSPEKTLKQMLNGE